MLAQDTGGAIKGPVRADFYYGTGPDAGQKAGRMKQKGRLWVLLPLAYPVAELNK
jgi:membrane-bound lytic murein transglycosylase A